MNVEFSAIEVPGEANPLTAGILYHVLRSASSTNPTQIQTGTKQLQTWEKAPRFYPLLQSVFLDKSLPYEVRYLAVIQLKNGIDKYWRKTATKCGHTLLPAQDAPSDKLQCCAKGRQGSDPRPSARERRRRGRPAPGAAECPGHGKDCPF